MVTTPALVQEIGTPSGVARLHLLAAAQPQVLLVLGHGAGGGVEAPDLTGLTRAAVAAGVTVGLVEQPYRVAGRRSAAPAARLDEGFVAVVRAALRETAPPAPAAPATEPAAGTAVPAPLPLVVGGRSSGARVACRTARTLGAAAVVALAFPLHPPGRPDRSTLAELAELAGAAGAAGAAIPCLVVQGERDAFGTAAELSAQVPAGVRVVPASGADHSLRRGLDARAVVDWLLAVCRRAVD